MSKEVTKANNEETFKEKVLFLIAVNVYGFFLIDGLLTEFNSPSIVTITVKVIWGILSAIMVHDIYSNKQEKARQYCIYAFFVGVVLNTVLLIKVFLC